MNKWLKNFLRCFSVTILFSIPAEAMFRRSGARIGAAARAAARKVTYDKPATHLRRVQRVGQQVKTRTRVPRTRVSPEMWSRGVKASKMPSPYPRVQAPRGRTYPRVTVSPERLRQLKQQAVRGFRVPETKTKAVRGIRKLAEERGRGLGFALEEAAESKTRTFTRGQLTGKLTQLAKDIIFNIKNALQDALMAKPDVLKLSGLGHLQISVPKAQTFAEKLQGQFTRVELRTLLDGVQKFFAPARTLMQGTTKVLATKARAVSSTKITPELFQRLYGTMRTHFTPMQLRTVAKEIFTPIQHSLRHPIVRGALRTKIKQAKTFTQRGVEMLRAEPQRMRQSVVIGATAAPTITVVAPLAVQGQEQQELEAAVAASLEEQEQQPSETILPAITPLGVTPQRDIIMRKAREVIVPEPQVQRAEFVPAPVVSRVVERVDAQPRIAARVEQPADVQPTRQTPPASVKRSVQPERSKSYPSRAAQPTYRYSTTPKTRQRDAAKPVAPRARRTTPYRAPVSRRSYRRGYDNIPDFYDEYTPEATTDYSSYALTAGKAAKPAEEKEVPPRYVSGRRTVQKPFSSNGQVTMRAAEEPTYELMMQRKQATAPKQPFLWGLFQDLIRFASDALSKVRAWFK